MCAAYTIFCDHDVVIVSISYTQYVGSHTVTGTGLHECLHIVEVL